MNIPTPLNIPAVWRTSQSLTVLLRALPHNFTVRVLSSDSANAQCCTETLGIFSPDTRLKTREVHLCLNDIPVIWARSSCEEHSVWAALMNRNTRPLGDVLFDSTLNIERSPIAFTENAASGLLLPTRLSVFYRSGSLLVLAESFLPAFADVVMAA